MSFSLLHITHQSIVSKALTARVGIIEQHTPVSMDYTTRFGAAVTMRTVKGTPERDIMAAALAAFIGALWAGQFLVTTIWGIAFVMGNQGISFERQI